MSRASETIQFRSASRTRMRRSRQRQVDRRRQLAELRPATVAKRLALAHRIAREIESGQYVDYADVARQHNLTRARVTQLMNLLLLAPDIQEAVLALAFPVGREPITEHTLRAVSAEVEWAVQRQRWLQVVQAANPCALSASGVSHAQRG